MCGEVADIANLERIYQVLELFAAKEDQSSTDVLDAVALKLKDMLRILFLLKLELGPAAAVEACIPTNLEV